MSWGLDRATVRFGEVVALQDVSLTAEPGQATVVVGGDGAGKTTLARALAGLVAVSSGTVRRVDRRRLGYQPAGSGVWPDLTVGENLAFMAEVHHVRAADADRRTTELLEITALGSARDRLGAQLSGGMRQKLGVVMALFGKPDLLILDEPTTGVDPVSRFDLWRLVSRAAADGAGVVMTTTYLDEAERAGTIVALDGGRMLAAGTPADVLRSMRGAVFSTDRLITGARQWRRGAAWRVWTDGVVPPGASAVHADLADVLVAAALEAEESP